MHARRHRASANRVTRRHGCEPARALADSASAPAAFPACCCLFAMRRGRPCGPSVCAHSSGRTARTNIRRRSFTRCALFLGRQCCSLCPVCSHPSVGSRIQGSGRSVPVRLSSPASIEVPGPPVMVLRLWLSANQECALALDSPYRAGGATMYAAFPCSGLWRRAAGARCSPPGHRWSAASCCLRLFRRVAVARGSWGWVSGWLGSWTAGSRARALDGLMSAAVSCSAQSAHVVWRALAFVLHTACCSFSVSVCLSVSTKDEIKTRKGAAGGAAARK
jgi:hypothetical protein